jgi:hypothetical protein
VLEFVENSDYDVVVDAVVAASLQSTPSTATFLLVNDGFDSKLVVSDKNHTPIL